MKRNEKNTVRQKGKITRNEIYFFLSILYSFLRK